MISIPRGSDRPPVAFRNALPLFRALAAGALALALAAGPGASRAAATGYTITDLGSLGGSRTLVSGMNNLGQVVGISNTGPAPDAPMHGFLFDGTGMHNLDAPLGGAIEWGRGINDTGQLVGSAWFSAAPGTPFHAFLFDGTLHDLTPLAVARSRAEVVNAKGHVAGWAEPYGGGNSPWLAFFYDGTSVHNLGTLPGYSQSVPTGINSSDQIAGAVGIDGWSSGQHAFLWTKGVMRDLGTLGGAYSWAFGINDAGQVVGRSTVVENGSQHAFLYDSSGMHDLGTLGGPASSAGGINNLGQVVGDSDTGHGGTDSPHHLFLYSNGVMQDLNPRLLSTPPWWSFYPWGINDRGQILIYGSIGPNEHGYLLTPTPAPEISLSPSHLDFGPQPAGTTSDPRTVTLTNTGDAPLSIAGLSIAGLNPFRFIISGGSGEATLAPGASRTVQITFNPLKAGDYSAALMSSDNDLLAGSSHRVALTGTGGLPSVSLSPPNSLDFGSHVVGLTSDDYHIGIGNSGLAPLVIHRLSITGPNASEYAVTDMSGVTIVPNDGRTISVRFTPVARGSRGATLVIDSNAPDSPAQISLTGNGLAPALRLSPVALDFGPQPVGLNSTLALLLRNTGDAPLNLGSLTFQGPNAAEFTLATGGGSGERLQPGDLILLNVRFSPTMTGSRGASLVIPSDAAASPQLVPLTGFGTAPLLRLSSDSLIFSIQSTGGSGDSQTLTLTNNGDAPLNIDGLTMDGPDAGSFHFISDSGEKSLAPGASRTVQISFRPAATASARRLVRIAAAHIAAVSYSATLEVQHNDPHPGSPHQIKLTAVETAPAAPTHLTATLTPANQVALTWTDNSSNETAFALWRQTGAGAFVRVGVVVPNTTHFTDVSVSPNTSYTYEVRATNNIGGSAWSNQANAATLLEAPPAAPTNLTATVISAGEIDLAWTRGGGNETGISVFRQSGGGDWQWIGVVAPHATGFADQGVKPGTKYNYRVRTHNDHSASVWTNEAGASTPEAPPAAPTKLTATVVSGSEIDLSWTSGGGNETGISLFRQTGGGGWQWIGVVAPSVTRYTDRSVRPGTSYTYRLRTHNDTQVSAWTSEASGHTPAAP